MHTPANTKHKKIKNTHPVEINRIAPEKQVTKVE